MPKISYIYCDANVFLAFFNAESERIKTLDQFFEEVQQDNHRKLVTSVISITEVSHIAEERMQHRLNKQMDDAFEGFWNDTSLIEFVDLNEIIARQARDLIRKAIPQKLALRPNDAIHLASAKFAGVSECLTYDKKLHRFNSLMGYDIREPYTNSPKLPFVFSDDPDVP